MPSRKSLRLPSRGTLARDCGSGGSSLFIGPIARKGGTGDFGTPRVPFTQDLNPVDTRNADEDALARAHALADESEHSLELGFADPPGNPVVICPDE